MTGTGFTTPQAVSSTWAKPSGIDTWTVPMDKQWMRLAFKAEKTGLTSSLKVRANFADPALVVVREGNTADVTGILGSLAGATLVLPLSGKRAYEFDVLTQLNVEELDWQFEFEGENVELSDFVVVKQGVI